MRRIQLLTMLAIAMAMSCVASATTYYVDPAGSNANDGLTPQTAWRTLLKVGTSSFNPGDVILFKRDAVWNEWLTPPSSGTAGNLIKFDAYGNGRPPEFTGFYQTKVSDWTNTSGNVWQITLSGTLPISQLKFVRFATIWGNAQTSQGALANDRDWYYDATNQILYVWSAGENPVTYYGSVNPIILSGQSLINLNNVNYVEIQHIKLDWYDSYGVQVQGSSDHIWLANMVADSRVPNGAVPIGFYIHPAAETDIHIVNTDSHRNYMGYRFDGSATGYQLTNCRAYANRTYGLMDNTAAVTYSHCHFYANNLATGISTDVVGTPGPIDGGGNVPADTAPTVRGFMQYPARITLTFDDPGLTDGPQEYLAPMLPMFQAKGVPLSIATVTGYDLSNQLIPTFQSWIDAGFDVNCHSVSHQYFVFPNAFTVQYAGVSASSVSLSISGKHLTITAPGDPSAQVSWDLTAPAPGGTSTGLDTLSGIVATLTQRGVFAVTEDPNMKTAVKSEDLADVPPTDIKSAALTLEMDKTRLMTDELGWSKQWMNKNLTGLFGHHSVTLNWSAPTSGPVPDSYNVYRSATSGSGYELLASGVAGTTYTDFAVNPQQTWYYVTTSVSGGVESGFSNEAAATVPGHWVYVYPGSYEDTSTEAIAVAAGYAGARGSGVMQPSPQADTVLGTGIDVQNILSQGSVPNFQNITDAQFANKLRALVFKSAVWGVPIGIFWHVNELSRDQVSLMLDVLKSSGATLMTNTQLVDYLVSEQLNAGTTNYVDASTGIADFRPTAEPTPVEVDQGMAIGDEFKFDLMGNDQSLFGTGWEIGATAYVPESLGTVK